MTKLTRNSVSLSKDLKTATFTIDLTQLNTSDPYITSGGSAKVLGDNLRMNFEVDVNGVTLPIDVQVGAWVGKNNWKDFVKNRDGIKEGLSKGTNKANIPEIDADMFAQFLAFQEFMKASSK